MRIFTYIVTLLAALYVPVIIFAQEGNWKSTTTHVGYSANDEGQAIIRTRTGALAMVGYANPPRNSGKDLFFVLIDGERVDTFLVHGRDKDEVAYDLVQTKAGPYAIVGYSNSEAKGCQGKRDGLFALISEDGHCVLEDTLLGSAEDDEFRTLAEDGNGDFIIAGQRNGCFWVLKLSAGGEILWEEVWKTEVSSTASSIAILNDGRISVVGYAEVKRFRYETYYLLLSRTGEVLSRKIFSDDRVLDLLATPDGNLVLTGEAPEQRGNLLLLKITPKGDTLWRHHYQGGYEYDNLDRGQAIILNLEGQLCVAGTNSSSLRGMNRNMGWVAIFNQAGDLLRDTLLGGNSEDSAQDICLTSEGALAMAGFTASGKSLFRDAWLVQFSPPDLEENWEALSLEDVSFVDRNQNGALDANETANLVVEVRNTGDKALSSERWQVQYTPATDLQLQASAVLPALGPGERTKVYISLAAGAELMEGRVSLQVSPEESGLRIPPQVIYTRKATFPDLVLSAQSDDTFLSQGGGLPARGEVVKMQVQLVNRGDRAAQDVHLEFVLPAEVTALGNPKQSITNLPVRGNYQFQLRLATEQLYQRDTVRIKVIVQRGGANKTLVEWYQLALQPFRSVTEEPQPVVVGGQEYVRLNWSSPNPDDVIRGTLLREDSLFSIRLVASSSQPLAERHFTVRQNEQIVNQGKFRNVSLLPSNGNRDGSRQEFSYVFSVENIVLYPGKNAFVVEVANGAGSYMADKLLVDYIPSKPNLHILSIGVPQGDLEFTTKDARDFADALAIQEGRLFGRVYTKILDTEATTRSVELKKAFRNLTYDFEGNKIRSQDVVVVFISTHGMTNNAQEMFRLAGSEFDEFYPLETTIDYERDFVDVLSVVPCTKMVFIDACQSGGVSYVDGGLARKSGARSRNSQRELADALTQLLQAQNGLRALASCGAEEFSYEDKDWENGAFTEAILEAFSNKEVKGKGGSLRANDEGRVLTLAELHDFLVQRVPYLVSKKEGAKTSQTPYLIEKYRSEELPLFYYEE